MKRNIFLVATTALVTLGFSSSLYAPPPETDEAPVASAAARSTAPEATLSRGTPAFQWDGTLPADHLQRARDLFQAILAHHQDTIDSLSDITACPTLSPSQKQSLVTQLKETKDTMTSQRILFEDFKKLTSKNTKEITDWLVTHLIQMKKNLRSTRESLEKGQWYLGTDEASLNTALKCGDELSSIQEFRKRTTYIGVSIFENKFLFCKFLCCVIPIHTLQGLELLSVRSFLNFCDVLRGHLIPHPDLIMGRVPTPGTKEIKLSESCPFLTCDTELQKLEKGGYQRNNLRKVMGKLPAIDDLLTASGSYWNKVEAFMKPLRVLEEEETSVRLSVIGAYEAEKKKAQDEILELRNMLDEPKKKLIIEEWDERQRLTQEEAEARFMLICGETQKLDQ